MNAPISPLSPGYPGHPAGGQPAHASRTVLVIDDVDVTRQRVRGILTGEGHRVIEASNGRRALQLLSGQMAVDAIVLDLVMPQMNGWDFRHTQLSDAHLARIPTVVLTVKYLTEYEKYALRAEVVVVKPFEDRDVTGALSQVLQGAELIGAPATPDPDTLMWSKTGQVACGVHAPERGGEKWLAEQWMLIPAMVTHKYQCQFCAARPIRHRRRRAAIGPSPGPTSTPS